MWGAVLPGVAARAHDAALAPAALEGAQPAPAQLEGEVKLSAAGCSACSCPAQGDSQAVCCRAQHLRSTGHWCSQRRSRSPEFVGLLLRIAETLLQEATAALLGFQQTDKLPLALNDIQCDCRLTCTGSQELQVLNLQPKHAC